MFTTSLVSSAERARVRTDGARTHPPTRTLIGAQCVVCACAQVGVTRTYASYVYMAHARARAGVCARLRRLHSVSRWFAASQQGSLKFLVTTLRLGLLRMKPWFHGHLPEREEHPKQIYVSLFL